MLGTGYRQEVRLGHLYADVAEYNPIVANPAQLPGGVVNPAIRTALARGGAAHLSLHADS